MTGEEATLALVANYPTSRATNGTSLRGELVSDRIHSKNHGALDVHEQCLLAARAKGGERDASGWSRSIESKTITATSALYAYAAMV